MMRHVRTSRVKKSQIRENGIYTDFLIFSRPHLVLRQKIFKRPSSFFFSDMFHLTNQIVQNFMIFKNFTFFCVNKKTDRKKNFGIKVRIFSTKISRFSKNSTFLYVSSQEGLSNTGEIHSASELCAR